MAKEHWIDVKRRLAEFPLNFYPDKTIEMLDYCSSIKDLQALIPYVSLGRLCLSRDIDDIHHYTNDCPCMYFHKEHYTISSYDNLNKWYFDSAEKAVEFVKQNIPLII